MFTITYPTADYGWDHIKQQYSKEISCFKFLWYFFGAAQLFWHHHCCGTCNQGYLSGILKQKESHADDFDFEPSNDFLHHFSSWCLSSYFLVGGLIAIFTTNTTFIIMPKSKKVLQLN